MRRRSNQSHLFPVGLVVITVLVIAGCSPIAVTPAAQSAGSPASASGTPASAATQAATSAASAAATAPVSAGTPGPAVFAGTVKHAGQPVPNARVELRALGWATNKTPPLATILADGRGNFSLTNPPVGDFSVVGYFPDGEMDAVGWPPVSIKAGQRVTGFVVPLERKLVLLSPIADSAAPATPTLKWNPVAGAAEYRVWIIDAGSTEVKLDMTTKDTALTGPSALTPGAYQWVVNGLDAGGQIVATGQETFVVKAAGASETPGVAGQATPGATVESYGLPPSCQPHAGETAVFSDRQHGFCFIYPAYFEKNAMDSGQANVVGVVAGPALDQSPDPVRATLLIEAVLADTPDLKAAVSEIAKEFEGQPGVKVTQRPLVLGGMPAALLEGVPGRGGTRDVVAVQNGFRFRLIFMPDPKQGFPQVQKDFQALFDAVTGSFTFLPPEVTESQGPSTKPGNMPRLPDQDRAFEGAREVLAKKLGVDPLAVQRVQVTPQEWNDACLGVNNAGEMCAQVITPGWTVILETGGKRYEAHTNQEGTSVRFVGLQ